MDNRRLTLLTNFIPPYKVPLFERLGASFAQFRVLISTEMEPNREWEARWGRIDVVRQKSWMFRQPWKHPKGFEDSVYVHVPYDTLPQLWRSRPDLVISGELGLRTVFARIYRMLNPRSRLVIWATLSESSEQGRGRLRNLLRRWLLRGADGFIVNGQSGERYLRSVAPIRVPVFHVPYACDTRLFEPVAERREAPAALASRLVYVGRLIPLKGLGLFLQVVRRWAELHPQRSLEFTLIGDGPLRREIEQEVYPPNLKVVCKGAVPYERVAEAYAEADFSVFPTLADEWGLVVNESLACGLPMLGSLYSQAVEELILDGNNGWHLVPDDLEASYRALDKALSSSQETRQRMSRAARQSVANLTVPQVAERVIAAARSVLPGEPAGGEGRRPPARRPG